MTEIRCVICGAMPYPTDPAVRVCFELRRFNAAGEISESPEPGSWYCAQHTPAKSKRTTRAVQGSPLEALGDFELLLADMTAQLVEALPHDDGDVTDDVDAALDDFGREIAGGLSQLKAAIVAHVKPPASTPKLRRSKSKRLTVGAQNLPGQTTLLEEEPTPS